MSDHVPLHDAVTKLRAVDCPLKAAHPGELDAAITHWLSTPDRVPPMASEADTNAWRRSVDPSQVDRSGVPFNPPIEPTFTFVDLFAGIGGFRLALQALGGHCVFSSEWNGAARDTYYTNFGEVPYGDIAQFAAVTTESQLTVEAIPDHDVLCGGFPCQPFSLAGVSARNSLGRLHGFACETQGTAFFHIAQIIRAKQPRAVILENVRNFVSHDQGRTLEVVRRVFRNSPDDAEPGLGYHLVEPFLVNSSTVVAQRRVRLFFVAFRDEADYSQFSKPEFEGDGIPLRSILDENVSADFTISDRLWAGHVARSARNRAAGKGFITAVADLDRPANTLVSRYYKDGKECLVPQDGGRNPRKLTPNECRKLMGFPEGYVLPDSRPAAYRQLGNAVVVPVVEKVGEATLSTWMGPTNLPRVRELVRQRVLDWGRTRYRDFAWRSSQDDWHALLAEVLLARTRAHSVEPTWKALLLRWPTAGSLASAEPGEVANLVAPLGLTARAVRLQALARAVTAGVPSSRAELASLPGVGPYTVAAYRSLHLNRREVLIDGNIVRWICRLNNWEYDGETRREARLAATADALTPRRNHRHYNYAVLDFAMTVCVPKKPHCEGCPLRDVCRHPRETEGCLVQPGSVTADDNSSTAEAKEGHGEVAVDVA